MAEDLASSERSPATAAPPAAPAEATPRERPVHRKRFLLAYFLLALVLGASLATAALLVLQPGAPAEQAWSAWQPSGDESSYPRQIAGHVASRYKLRSGDPMVRVVAQRPEVQDVAIRWVAVRGSNEIVSADHAVMYILCGDGNRCSIKEGRPSIARHRALQRESLELALYTFKYADSFDSVIALLPPAPNGNSSGMLYFRKQDFRPELERPLEETVALPDAPHPPRVAPGEVRVLRKLTFPHLFSYRFQQAPDGSVGLLLAPPG